MAYDRPEGPCTADYDPRRFTERQIQDTAKLLFGDAVIPGWDCSQTAALLDYKAVVDGIQSKLDSMSSSITALDVAPPARSYRKKLLEDLKIQAFLQTTEAKFFKTREAGVLLQRYEGVELKECRQAFAAVRAKARSGASDSAALCRLVGTDWFDCELAGLRRRRGAAIEPSDAETLWAGVVSGEKCGGDNDAD